MPLASGSPQLFLDDRGRPRVSCLSGGPASRRSAIFNLKVDYLDVRIIEAKEAR
jgi:hypothetical protein